MNKIYKFFVLAVLLGSAIFSVQYEKNFMNGQGKDVNLRSFDVGKY